MVTAPPIIPGETGTFKFIVNVSFPSTMSSSIIVIFTVLLLVPAVIITFCVVELKSTSLPMVKHQMHIYVSHQTNVVMCKYYQPL